MIEEGKYVKLIDLEGNIASLCRSHTKYLSTYLKNDLFSRPTYDLVKTNNTKIFEVERKESITSSCFALISLINSDFTNEEIAKHFDNHKLFSNLRSILLDESKVSQWKTFPSSDVYKTIVKLLFLIKFRDEQVHDILKSLNITNVIKIEKEIKKIRTEYSKSGNLIALLQSLLENFYANDKAIRFDDTFDFSAFLSYNGFLILLSCYDILTKQKLHLHVNDSKLNSDSLESIMLHIFRRLYEWSEGQIYEQISFYEHDDYDGIDPVRATYCILIYKKYHEFYHLHYDNIFGTPHRIKKYNEYQINKLISKISENLIKRQNFWKKYLPVGIKADKFGDVHIYPFPLTWISELLRLNKMSNEDHENFVNIVEYVLDWLDKNERIAYGTKSPIPIREKAYIGKFSGWRSPQSVYPRGNPESWSTSLVFDSLWRMRRKIKKVLSNEIIKYFNGTIGNEKLAEEKFVTRRDSDIFFDNITHKYSLKKIIFYNIIEPRLKYRKPHELKNYINSVLLYGPPGTGKSSLVRSIAEAIGWSYVRIDTGIFLKNGFDRAGETAQSIFKLLSKLEKTAILFDEIDELIQSREGRNATMENKLLTNTFLTLLNDLAENKEIIFFIATNYSNKIDGAIIRQGRIDFKLFVNYQSTVELIETFKLDLRERISKNVGIQGFRIKNLRIQYEELEATDKEKKITEHKLSSLRIGTQTNVQIPLSILEKSLNKDAVQKERLEKKFSDSIDTIGKELLEELNYIVEERSQSEIIFNLIKTEKLKTAAIKIKNNKLTDTDFTPEKIKFLINLIIEKMQSEKKNLRITDKDNQGVSDLHRIVNDYFGSIGIDALNQIKTSTVINPIYPLKEMKYDPNLDNKLRDYFTFLRSNIPNYSKS